MCMYSNKKTKPCVFEGGRNVWYYYYELNTPEIIASSKCFTTLVNVIAGISGVEAQKIEDRDKCKALDEAYKVQTVNPAPVTAPAASRNAAEPPANPNAAGLGVFDGDLGQGGGYRRNRNRNSRSRRNNRKTRSKARRSTRRS